MLSQTFWLPSFLRNKSRWRQMSLIGVWPSLPWATNANTARTFCLPMLPAQCSPLYGWTIGRDQTWMLVSGGVSTGETKFGETIWRWQHESCKTRRGKSHLDPGSIEGHQFFGGTVGRGTIGKWEMSHFEGASHLEPGPLRGVKVGESQGHEKPLFFILATLVARTSTTLG